ncbi:MAG: cytochrome c biogenesis protein CcdA [Chloroflexota bacterium]|nr:cytochrome c biogenesis protein CcdA [Chloroflexota bacterium]
MGGQEITYSLALSAGLLSFLSPCVLPLVPIYLGYLTGAGAGNHNVAVEQSRTFTLAHGLAFVIGFSLVFIAWGAIGGLVGDLVNHPWFLRVGAILLMVMGLHLIGVIQIPLLYMEKRLEIERSPDPNVISSLLVGATFGAGWTPCVGPVLAGILSLAALQGGALQGAALLSVYSLGLAIPFLVAAVGLGQASAAIRKLGPYLRYIEMASGVLLIFIGILLFTGQFTQLNSFFLQLTPEWLYERL